MKKILLIACVIFSLFAVMGCNQNPEDQTNITYVMPVWKGSLEKAPENPELGWAYYNTTDKTSYIYDGKDWQIMSKDGSDGAKGTDGKDGKDGVNGKDAALDSSLKDLGESTETVDGVEYKVHSYAEVYANVPYYFTYYKHYYLNDKLRRLYIYYHGMESDLDYTYENYEEHVSYSFSQLVDFFGGEYNFKKEITFYEDGKIETCKVYRDETDYEWYKFEYFESGELKKKHSKYPYEHGEISYSIDNFFENKQLGGTNSHDGGELHKAEIRFEGEDVNSNVRVFREYYESGYLKSYYAADRDGGNYLNTGFLYTYEDNKTKSTSTSESVFASKQEKTSAEIKSLFESL